MDGELTPTQKAEMVARCERLCAGLVRIAESDGPKSAAARELLKRYERDMAALLEGC